MTAARWRNYHLSAVRTRTSLQASQPIRMRTSFPLAYQDRKFRPAGVKKQITGSAFVRLSPVTFHSLSGTDYEQFDRTEHASECQLHILPTIFIFRFILKPICIEECQTEEKTYSKNQRQQQLATEHVFEQYLGKFREKKVFKFMEKNVMIEKADQKYAVTGTVDDRMNRSVHISRQRFWK